MKVAQQSKTPGLTSWYENTATWKHEVEDTLNILFLK
jgi:hypothetical protein